MALYIIDTKHFGVVNVDDTSVTAEGSANTWLAARDAGVTVADGATVIRVRALTGPEVESIDLDVKGFALHMAAKAVHADDVELFAALPWHYRRSLGGFVYEVSTFPLDRAKGPSSESQPGPKS